MSATKNTGSRVSGWTLTAAFTVNGTIIAVLVVAAILHSVNSDLYYRSVQEDGLLEWMTFWAFALAAVALTVAGFRQRTAGSHLPWFFWGVAAFCFFVALEEISWGQRLFGYRPPEYFLRENFQQELNFHNVFSTSLRKFLLKAVILGYGVVLPLVAIPRTIGRTMARLAITPPPLALAPAFLATFMTYQIYPWSFSGEWVELMLGLGFLLAGITHLQAMPNSAETRPHGFLRPLIAGITLTAVLAGGSAALSLLRPEVTPAMVETTRSELERLAGDFMVTGRTSSRCGVHKRVFTFAEEYDRHHLYEGAFANLVAQGLPDERAKYFLDPWNSPIWLRHRCIDSSRRERAFVYSFGPDRRRDSSAWEIRGDDIGVVIFERGT